MWCSRGCLGPHATSVACLWHVSVVGGARRRGCAAGGVSVIFNRLLGGAVGAAPVDREVREARLVAERLADRVARAIELVRSNRDDLAAALADEVFALAVADQAVEAGAMADVHVAHYAELLE